MGLYLELWGGAVAGGGGVDLELVVCGVELELEVSCA
jgi:hypothetical protein